MSFVFSVMGGLVSACDVSERKVQLAALHVIFEKVMVTAGLQHLIPLEKVNDPVGVWDLSEANSNLYTFIVYIEWLWRQEEAFAYYDRLMVERFAEVNACLQKLRDVAKKER